MHVSERTVYNWIYAGKVEYFKTPGGHYRVYEDSLRKRPEPGTKVNTEV
jgi:excisionase family DNA binding protein